MFYRMMLTSIQLNENVKNALDRMKSNKETYEDIIVNLMNYFEEQKRNQEKLLIEGCKEMYDDMLNVAKDWEGTLMDGLDKNEKWGKL